jgi:hypothetical protein
MQDILKDLYCRVIILDSNSHYSVLKYQHESKIQIIFKDLLVNP